MLEIKMKFALSSDLDGSAMCECDRCGHELPFVAVDELDLTGHDLVVGDEIPAGSCPECDDGFMYLQE